MAATNVTNSSTILDAEPWPNCAFTPTMRRFNYEAHWYVNAYFMPLFLVFGLLGRVLCLVAFYQQVKTEAAYLYQIFTSYVELIEVITSVVYTTTRYLWSGWVFLGERWFRSCYACMLFETHLSNPLQMAAGLCSLLVSLCMTADRMYALCLPMRYANARRRKLQHWIIFALCNIISVLLVIPVVLLFRAVWDEQEGVYQFTFSDYFAVVNPMVKWYVYTKLAVALVLLMANRALAFVYKYRMSKRRKLAKGKSNNNQELEEIRKVRTLFQLTFIQSSLDVLSTSGTFISNTTSWYPWLRGLPCASDLIGPFLDVTKAVANLSDFYVSFALIKSFRVMVVENVRKSLGLAPTNKVSAVVKSSTGDRRTTRM